MGGELPVDAELTEHVFEMVAEGPMPEVVAQARHQNAEPVRLRHLRRHERPPNPLRASAAVDQRVDVPKPLLGLAVLLL